MHKGTKAEAAEARQARLAEALRENLKRRKSQTRARKAAPAKTDNTKPDADATAREQD